MHSAIIRASQEELVFDVGACWSASNLRFSSCFTSLSRPRIFSHRLDRSEAVRLTLLGCRGGALHTWCHEEEPVDKALVACHPLDDFA